jgi:hypothetical protein
LRAIVLLACALALGPPAAVGAELVSARKPGETAPPKILQPAKRAETVTFGNSESNPVIVVRGGQELDADPGQTRVETVTFGNPLSRSVRMVKLGNAPVVAGRNGPVPQQPPGAIDKKIETVMFADPRYQPVTVIKGSVFATPAAEVFNPANGSDLDRVAFAVEAAESTLGTDPRMWRPNPNGPQGPMQVSLAAAMDVGGGDRFAEPENRALGRAYLDHLYRRYGNWPDAVAAYNWGPGNIDAWIGAGRPVDKFPIEVERYRDRVLQQAGLPSSSVTTLTSPP